MQLPPNKVDSSKAVKEMLEGLRLPSVASDELMRSFALVFLPLEMSGEMERLRL